MAQDTIRTISLNNQVPGSVSQFNNTLPLADGEGSAGTSPNPARADHQHPIAIDVIYNAIYDKLYQSISQSIKEADHPVNSLYFTMSTENPKFTFGFGEWTKIEGKFILGASSKYPLNSTGGSADAIAVNHNHTQNMVWDYGNGQQISLANVFDIGGNVAEMYGGQLVYNNGQREGWGKWIRTSNSGEDGADKNMPPYLAVNVWYRTK